MCNCGVSDKNPERTLLVEDIVEEDNQNTIIINQNSLNIEKNNELQLVPKYSINTTDIHNPFVTEDINYIKEKFFPDNIQITENTNKIYNLFNDPRKNKRIWTKEEDEFLLDYLKKNQNSRNWKKISEILKTKTPQQCTYRYNKLIEQMTKRKWTRGEDIKLIELIEVYNKNWEIIAREFPHRSLKEIEERFTKKLDPNIKKSRFSEEEDELLIKLYEKYEKNWVEISKYFKSRSVPVLKKRLFSFLRSRITKVNSNPNNSCVNTLETSINKNSNSLSNISVSISGNADQGCLNNLSLISNNSYNNINELSNLKNIEENKNPNFVENKNKNIHNNLTLNMMEQQPQNFNSDPFYILDDSFGIKHYESECIFKSIKVLI